MLVGVYGTLKYDYPNYQYYMESEAVKYIGQGWVDGYELYHDGQIPYAVKGSGSIWVEVYDFDLSTKEGMGKWICVHLMETDAGYTPKKVEVTLGNSSDVGSKLVDTLDARIFLAHIDTSSNLYRKINSGVY